MSKPLTSALTALIEVACLTPVAIFSLSGAEGLLPSSSPPAATWAVHTQAAVFAATLASALLAVSVRKASRLGKGAGHWLLRTGTAVYCKTVFIIAALYATLLVKALLLGGGVLEAGQQRNPEFLRVALLNNGSSASAESALLHTFFAERTSAASADAGGPNLQVYLSSPRQDWLDAALGARGWQTLGSYNLTALNLTDQQKRGVSSVNYHGVPSTYIPVLAYIFAGATAAYMLLSLMLAIYLAYSSAPEGQQDAIFVDHGTLAIASVFIMYGTDRAVAQGYSACAPALEVAFEAGCLSLAMCSINLCHGLTLTTLGSVYSGAGASRGIRKARKVFVVVLGTFSLAGASTPAFVALGFSVKVPWLSGLLVALWVLASLSLWTYLVWVYRRETRFAPWALRIASVATPFMLSTAPAALPFIILSSETADLVFFELPGLVLLPALAVCAFTRYWPWASHLLRTIPSDVPTVSLPAKGNPPFMNPQTVPKGTPVPAGDTNDDPLPQGMPSAPTIMRPADAGLFCIPEKGFLQQRSPTKRASPWAPKDFTSPPFDPNYLRSQLQGLRSPALDPHSRPGTRSMPPVPGPEYWQSSSHHGAAAAAGRGGGGAGGDPSVFHIPQHHLASFGVQVPVAGSRPPPEHPFLPPWNTAAKTARYTV